MRANVGPNGQEKKSLVKNRTSQACRGSKLISAGKSDRRPSAKFGTRKSWPLEKKEIGNLGDVHAQLLHETGTKGGKGGAGGAADKRLNKSIRLWADESNETITGRNPAKRLVKRKRSTVMDRLGRRLHASSS